ncbi:MAG: hypothetical protein AAF804_09560, partial [Bacteroidota bacterium]
SPATPRLTNPGTVPSQGRERCLQPVPLESDFTLAFSNDQAAAFELRVFLDYIADGQAKEAVFGPTTMFVDDVRCSQQSNFCYRFGSQEILRSFRRQVEDEPSNSLRYEADDAQRCAVDIADLPRVLRFELTSMDRHLFLYRQANGPQVGNVNTVRPEYTNVSGPEGSITLGILGSYETAFSFGRLSDCSEFLLNFNGTPQPNPACAFQ